jgi:hypothetical protein
LDLLEQGVYDEVAHQARLAKARTAWSQPELMRKWQEMIRAYGEKVTRMEALETEWVNPGANRRPQEIEDDWLDLLDELRRYDKDIEGIVFLMR